MKCKIISSNFSTARIRESNFQQCELNRSEIVRSSFDESDMSFSILKNIKSIQSQFTKANFVGAQLTNVNFDIDSKIDEIESTNMICINCSSNITSLT